MAATSNQDLLNWAAKISKAIQHCIKLDRTFDVNIEEVSASQVWEVSFDSAHLSTKVGKHQACESYT